MPPTDIVVHTIPTYPGEIPGAANYLCTQPKGLNGRRLFRNCSRLEYANFVSLHSWRRRGSCRRRTRRVSKEHSREMRSTKLSRTNRTNQARRMLLSSHSSHGHELLLGSLHCIHMPATPPLSRYFNAPSQNAFRDCCRALYHVPSSTSNSYSCTDVQSMLLAYGDLKMVDATTKSNYSLRRPKLLFDALGQRNAKVS